MISLCVSILKAQAQVQARVCGLQHVELLLYGLFWCRKINKWCLVIVQCICMTVALELGHPELCNLLLFSGRIGELLFCSVFDSILQNGKHFRCRLASGKHDEDVPVLVKVFVIQIFQFL